MIAHALFNSEPLDADKMYDEYAEAAEKIAPVRLRHGRPAQPGAREGESVMFEGAQGTMLDIDHGTYPVCDLVERNVRRRGHRHRRCAQRPSTWSSASPRRTARAWAKVRSPAKSHDDDRRQPAQARQRIRRGHRTSAALRLARSAASALRWHD